jgi:hypothetical protein
LQSLNFAHAVGLVKRPVRCKYGILGQWLEDAT